MSTSSPADLAIAFRSLPRRIERAASETTQRAAVEAAGRDMQAAIAAAAAQLGAPATADAVAAAIDGRHLSDWTDPELAELQRHANAAARSIRTLEDLSERK